MPRIFDNIELPLLPNLRETLKVAYRADFCVGYFNLRGWQKIDDSIEQFVGGENLCCRLLIGMQSLPSDEITVKFNLDDASNDTYSHLYSASVIEVINQLNLPRYGLGNYIAAKPSPALTELESRQISGLFRGGRRLMGFSRTNLFKRLESSGVAFIQSIERHILRNFIYLYAVEQGLNIPIGTQEADLLDSRNNDEDSDSVAATLFDADIEDETETVIDLEDQLLQTEKNFRKRAEFVYQEYASRYQRRFKWLRSSMFDIKKLKKDLLTDAKSLINILQTCGEWNAQKEMNSIMI